MRKYQAGFVQTFETHDFDEMARAVPTGYGLILPLTKSKFAGDINRFELDTIGIGKRTCNSPIYLRSSLSSNLVGFAIVAQPAEALHQGRSLGSSELMVIGAGREFNLRTAGPHEMWSLGMDLRDWQAWCESQGVSDFTNRGRADRLTVVDPRAPARLARHLDLALATMRANPAMLAESAVRKALQEDLLYRLVAGTAAGVNPVRMDEHSATVLAKRAEEFILSHLAGPLTVADVCAAIDTNERTLRYAFHRQFGMGANAYLRLRRLIGVRRALNRVESAQETNVSETALRWGFWHFSQFAADYRKTFGELPSATLRRAA
jgi:AraC family ethanolamine operon transcriptional activator